LVKSIFDIRPDVPLEQLRASWQGIATHGSVRADVTWIRADGSPLALRVTARLLQRQPPIIQVRARLQENARSAEQARWQRFLAQVLDTLPGDAVLGQDAGGRVVYANAAAARMYGYVSGEALCAAGADELAARLLLRDATGRRIGRNAMPAQQVMRGEEPGEL